MKQYTMALVFVLAVLVGGCYALPPIQMGGVSSSEAKSPCGNKETEEAKMECEIEREKMRRQLVESGMPDPRSTASASLPGAPQPAFLPSPAPAPVANMQFSMFYDPAGGNAENGCGGARRLDLTNNASQHEPFLELVADGVQRCGNGGSLIPIIVETGGGVRIAFVVPPHAGTPGTYYRTKRGKTSGRIIAYENVPEALAGTQLILDAIQRTGTIPQIVKVQPGFASVNGVIIPTVGTTGHPDCWSTDGSGHHLDERDSHFFGPTSSC